MTSKSNVANWKSMMTHLRRFTSNDIRLSNVDENFLNNFKEYLLNTSKTKGGTKLSSNAASAYFNKLKAGLREANNRSTRKYFIR